MPTESFKNFLENLKDQISAIDIISKHVKLERRGHDWFGRCPFHSEKTGSFKVDPERGLYYCFGCGAHGDVIKFVMETEKMSFMEAVKYLANVYGMQVPEEREESAKYKAEDEARSKMYEIMEKAKSFFQRQLKNGANEKSKKALEYLKNRNISAESIDKFQLGFACNEDSLLSALRKEGFSDDIIIKTGVFFKSQYNSNKVNNKVNNRGDLISKFSDRITFPIIDSRERCVGFGGRIVPDINKSESSNSKEKSVSKEKTVAKYLNSPETEIFIKNHQLYGYNLARRGQSRDTNSIRREIVLVEGYMDVIAMHQAGFTSAVAPLGTSISETQINMCWKVCDNPIICLDGDDPGKKASFRWLDKILPMLIPGKSFRFARLPQDSDPDALVLNGRSDLIELALGSAQSLSDWMWDGAFLLYPSNTPEEKAAIIKMLKDKTHEIKDGSIERLYIQYIKQKENELYRYKWKPLKNFSGSDQKTREPLTPVVSVGEKTEKILVVTIINHPYIIDKIIERFAEVEFSSQWAQKMKKEIMRIYDQFYIAGENQKGAEAIKELSNNIASIERDIEIHARFVGKFEKNGISEEDVILGWHNFFEKHRSTPAIAEDLHAASVSLQSSFSESDWQRLKALKNSMLLAKNKV